MIPNRRHCASAACLALLVASMAFARATAALAQAAPAPRVADLQAEAWPQADRLFRGDPHWRGSDCAYSIDLGGGRSLWLFGDTIIDPTGASSRKSPGVKMIGNTVAIQTGADPSKATIKFAWRTGDDGAPAAFFPDRDGCRYW